MNGSAIDGRSVYIPKTPEVFAYDSDGDLLSDGRWDYTWDGENRLIAMQTRYGLPSGVPIVRLEFSYDYLSRRVQKRSYVPAGPPPPTDTATGVDAESG